MNDATPAPITHVDLQAEYQASGVADILDELDRADRSFPCQTTHS